MSRVVIGIHGLGNKPPRAVLENWWLKAMREGLVHRHHPGVFFRFELAYWADILHPYPQKAAENNRKSEYFIEHPYIPATDFIERPANQIRRMILDLMEKVFDKLYMKRDHSTVFDSVSGLIIRRYFQDLDSYYSLQARDGEGREVPARDMIRNRLAEIIRKYRRQKILLIAHSMGSLIAYEVLSLLENEVEIDTLVTIGSPLGQPIVINRFLTEYHREAGSDLKPRTPANIRHHWFNLLDPEDHVSMNYRLADHFDPSFRHIQPVDKLVYNNYVYEKKRNPHQSFGYLRTTEMGEILYDFLSRDRSRFGFWLSNRFHGIGQRIRGSKEL